jgi:peptidoglycan/LPS O-acetylase OafA/YrhL
MAIDNPLEHWLSVILRGGLAGTAAVEYFFVLSGFVLTMSLDRTSSTTWKSAFYFLVQRLLRIYPAVFVAVFLFAALYYSTGLALRFTYDLWSIVQNCLLLSTSINFPTWSVQVELLATPLLFLTFLLARKVGPICVPILAFGLYVLSYQEWWLALSPLQDPVPTTKFLYMFPLGAAIYWYGRRLLGGTGPKRASIWITLAITAIFIASLDMVPFYGQVWQGYSFPAVAIASAVIVATFAYGENNVFKRWMGYPWARLLGRVSYSFYLLHPLSLTVLRAIPATWYGAMLDRGLPPSVLVIVLWAVSSLAILPLAMLSYRYVETPGIKFAKWITGVRSVSPAVSSSEPLLQLFRARASTFGVAAIRPAAIIIACLLLPTSVNLLIAPGSAPVVLSGPASPSAPLIEGLTFREGHDGAVLQGQPVIEATYVSNAPTRRATYLFGSVPPPTLVGWITRRVFWKPAIYSGKDIVYRAEAWIKPGTERLIALAPQDEPRSNRVWAEFDLSVRPKSS